MIRSPKSRFHDKAGDVSRLAELVATPEFLHAVDTAMCQFIHTMPMVKDAHGSMAMAHKIEGANEFVKELLTLADKVEAQRKMTSVGNLPGNVRNDEPVKRT